MTNPTCPDCGAPFEWAAPGVKGRLQRWYRTREATRRGDRCADRVGCKRRQRDAAAED